MAHKNKNNYSPYKARQEARLLEKNDSQEARPFAKKMTDKMPVIQPNKMKSKMHAKNLRTALHHNLKQAQICRAAIKT